MFSLRSSFRIYSISLLLLPALLQLLPSGVADSSSQTLVKGKIELTRGVPKSKLHLYDPSKAGRLFTCGNGQKEIPWSSVNNDYCDCDDASDEPGTSACPNGKFYCSNKFHKPGHVISSRVNDGVCDPECCDGTDEYNGKIVCPNICKEVKEKEHRLRKQAFDAQQTGYALKKEYSSKGRQLKLDRQKEVVKLESELKQAKIKAVTLKAALELAEREEERDRKSNQGSQKKLAECQTRLTETSQKLQSQRKHISTLLNLLRDLERDHNKNYHDMAVKSAVKGYEEIKEIVDLEESGDIINDAENDVTKDSLEDNEKLAKCQTRLTETTQKLQAQRKYSSTLMNLLRDLKRDHNKDYNDVAVKAAVKSYEDIMENVDLEDSDDIFDDSQNDEGEDAPLPYTPFPVRPKSKSMIITDFNAAAELAGDLWNEIIAGVKDRWYNLKEWITGEADLERLVQNSGMVRDAKSASIAYNSAVTAESDIERRLKEVKSKLDIDFGLEEEWAAIDGTCIEKDTVGFVYKVCPFGKASQNSDGGGLVALGNFHKWIGAEDRSQPGYYNKMEFKGGVKCWDGPERSITVSVECGAENVLLEVTEPEKCMYVGRFASPAACSEPVVVVHDEL